eukprot:scpid66138/ scgid11280/ 
MKRLRKSSWQGRLKLKSMCSVRGVVPAMIARRVSLLHTVHRTHAARLSGHKAVTWCYEEPGTLDHVTTMLMTKSAQEWWNTNDMPQCSAMSCIATLTGPFYKWMHVRECM